MKAPRSASWSGRAACLLLVLGAAVGCTTSEPPSRASSESSGSPDASSSSGSPSGGGQAPEDSVAVDVESVEGPHGLEGSERPELGRDARRLRIDALEAAMIRVAGTDIDGQPLQWKVNGVNGFSDASFGKALGRPDYRNVTDENPTSSALYLKLVGDAARNLCTQMVRNDLRRSDASSRVLFPRAAVDGSATAADVDDNLRYLLLRFLGLRVAADHPMVGSLRGVYEAGRASMPAGGTTPPEAEGWRGVCVALYESPLFHND
jgi:hypothetical protein